MKTRNGLSLTKLSVMAVESSPKIRDWLSQFPDDKQITAKMMLCRLNFVSRDTYSEWFRKVIAALPTGETHALYAVRKLREDETDLWSEEGTVASRPGTSLGSEDLVYSLISNVVRADPSRLLDHPSLAVLRKAKVHDFVLVDDSIGSGDRVSGFINVMLNHPTFLSWWNYGFIRINVISFTRTRESESKIIAKIRGSDHSKRKYPKSSKIEFTSEVVYSTDWIESRWGENYRDILDLCRDQTKVKKWARLGYGDVMANTVFHHSVPNNLPGVVWFQNEKWNGLFPGRALPDWLLALLDEHYQRSNSSASTKADVPEDIKQLLVLVKRGIRRTTSLASRLNCDHKFAMGLLARATELGLVSEHGRLTPVGLDLLKQENTLQALPTWDRSLYIPTSWCAGRATIQPPVSEELAPVDLADSVEAFTSADGDVGQASLEGSDAKAATPPFSVMPQTPTKTRKRHDTDGPPGSKDR